MIGAIISCGALIISTVLWVIAYNRERNYSKHLSEKFRELKAENIILEDELEKFCDIHDKLIKEKEKAAQNLSSCEKAIKLLPNDYQQFIKAEIERMNTDA